MQEVEVVWGPADLASMALRHAGQAAQRLMSMQNSGGLLQKRFAGDLPAKTNKYVEDWGAFRENVEFTYRCAASWCGAVGAHNICLLPRALTARLIGALLVCRWDGRTWRNLAIFAVVVRSGALRQPVAATSSRSTTPCLFTGALHNLYNHLRVSVLQGTVHAAACLHCVCAPALQHSASLQMPNACREFDRADAKYNRPQRDMMGDSK